MLPDRGVIFAPPLKVLFCGDELMFRGDGAKLWLFKFRL